MLRILLIERYKNTKINNFKAFNVGKLILKIAKLKICLMIIQIMDVRCLFYNHFKSTINNYRSFRI